MKFQVSIKYLLLIILIAIADQWTKSTAMLATKDGSVAIAPFLSLVQAWNTGMSFGLFNGTDYSNATLLLIAIGAIAFFFLLLHKADKALEAYGYCCVLGGAIGNVLDRFKYGRVFDFISMHFGSVAFPVFNVADAFISLGGTLFVLGLIFRK